jgi:hypothetical protein
MARQARSYANLSLTPNDPVREEGETEAAHVERVLTQRKNSMGRPKRSGLGDEAAQVKSKSHHHMVYISVEAAKTMKLHALQTDGKMSDITIEALQHWMDSHGYKVKVRVRGANYEGPD